jgi:hypothetical protein
MAVARLRTGLWIEVRGSGAFLPALLRVAAACAIVRSAASSRLRRLLRRLGEITNTEAIAVGRAIRQLARLTTLFGKGRWRKMRG